MNLGDIWGAASEPTQGEKTRHHLIMDAIAEYMEGRLQESGGAGRQLCEDLHLIDFKTNTPDAYEYEAFKFCYYDKVDTKRAESVYARVEDIQNFWMMCSWLHRGFSHHGMTDTQIRNKLMINGEQLKAMYNNDQKAFCFAGVATVQMTLREFVKLEK
uniref:Uncharacterized protein n=1 Tax=Pseudomonas phage Nican01 TaxID=3138540 RepID=A0AAU6W102_9CAUD